MANLFSVESRRRGKPAHLGWSGVSIETAEVRCLPSATVLSAVAEVSTVAPSAKTPGNFAGFWLFEGTSSHFLAMQQAGDSVTGDEMQGAISVGTLTGKVRGIKLKAEVVGFGYTSTYKVKLTDEAHFTGIVKTVLDGKKQKPETVNATNV